MKLEVKNVGVIKEGAIKLNGLTVIAGENDTGKSFIGKVLFSVVKAFNRYEEDLGEDKIRRVSRLVDNIYFWIRRYFPNIIRSEWRRSFSPNLVMKDIQQLIYTGDAQDVDNFIDKKINIVEGLDTGSNGRALMSKLNDLRELLQTPDDRKSVIVRAMSKAFLSEFFFDVNAKANQDLPAEVNYSENDLNVFNMNINDNRITEFECEDEAFLFEGLYFTDVTFIETPILLQMYDLVRRSGTLFDLNENDSKTRRMNALANPVIPLHMKDLMRKLENAQYYDPKVAPDIFGARLVDRINEIIDGDMIFDEDESDFRFRKKDEKGNEVDLKTINTATGIKSFGILNLLLKIDLLDERSLLIIDEPEVHLHPRWQVEYAKIVALLVKHGVTVLITTHSPYIVQALKVCCDETGVGDKANYYLSERDESGHYSSVSEVTGDLNRVFKRLSEPLQELVWG